MCEFICLVCLLLIAICLYFLLKFVEQELLAYEDIYSLDPELCKLMQIKICDILLKDVYTTKDCCLDKLRILLKKGRALKASGIEHLKGCIQCLSEAISLLVIRFYSCIFSPSLLINICLQSFFPFF